MRSGVIMREVRASSASRVVWRDSEATNLETRPPCATHGCNQFHVEKVRPWHFREQAERLAAESSVLGSACST